MRTTDAVARFRCPAIGSRLLAVSCLTAVLGLTACSSTAGDRSVGSDAAGSGSDVTSAITSTGAPFSESRTPTPTAVHHAVDPADYADGDNYVFAHRTGGRMGTCVIGERGVTCMGAAVDDIPDVQVPPFPPGRPSAVTLSDEGVDYGIFEGAPPAPAELDVHDSITAEGVTCTVVDEATFTCTRGGDSFTLTDDYHWISTSRAPIGRYFVDSSAGETGGSDDTGNSVGASGKQGTCEDDGGDVTVISGDISCADAVAIMNEYERRAPAEGGGNILAMEIGDWGCSSPTAARSAETGASATCVNSASGVEIHRRR